MRILGALWLVTLALPLVAQDTFHSQSREVLVPVTITDGKGMFVDGLHTADFQLLDDGVPQHIASMDTFGTVVAPISLVIAVQGAGISAPALAKIRQIGDMIVPLITGDRGAVAVLAFDSELHLVQDFTNDNAAVANALNSVRPVGEKTARMLDAADNAIHGLAARPNTRRVLLRISESRDRGSKTKLATVLSDAEQFNVSIYAASYSVYATTFVSKPEDVPPPGDTDLLAVFTEPARLGKTNTVRALAAATGGTVESFTRVHALQKIVEHLGAELHSQYILGFVPQNNSPGFHRLQVRVNDTALHVRARPGYQMVAEPAKP